MAAFFVAGDKPRNIGLFHSLVFERLRGLDLASSTDITVFVLVFPPENEDDKYAVLPYFWIPEETLDLRVRRDHVNYDLWERQGYIKTTMAMLSTTVL